MNARLACATCSPKSIEIDHIDHIDLPEVIGVVAFQIDSRQGKVAYSTCLRRTSEPCIRGSIEQDAFNTGSYGETTYGGDCRIAGRCGPAVGMS